MNHIRSQFTLVVALILCTALALTIAGCSSESDDSPEADSATDSAGAFVDGPSIMDALVAEYDDATWLDEISDIEVRQELLADVVFISTTIDPNADGAIDTASEIADSTLNLVMESLYNVRVMSSEGVQMVGAASGSSAADALGLPSAPGDPVSLNTWLDNVFADSGEAWFDHLGEITLSDTEPGWTGTTLLVVQTDLEPAETEERSRIAQTIGAAITMSGQTMATSYIVLDADGNNIISGGLPVATYAY